MAVAAGSAQFLDDVELATLEYVDWFNRRRLHSSIGMIPAAELEATYYDQTPTAVSTSPNSTRASIKPGGLQR
jgi:hypothetical protein